MKNQVKLSYKKNMHGNTFIRVQNLAKFQSNKPISMQSLKKGHVEEGIDTQKLN